MQNGRVIGIGNVHLSKTRTLILYTSKTRGFISEEYIRLIFNGVHPPDKPMLAEVNQNLHFALSVLSQGTLPLGVH